jgi:hypothetical protein
MTRVAARHRDLDRAYHAALGEPVGGHALVPSPRILLTTLSVRTSAKGRPYLSGFLGKSRVVAFEGEADRFGNPTWDIFVAEPEPRDGPAAARQRASGSESAFASTETPASAGGSYGAMLRPEHHGVCHG